MQIMLYVLLGIVTLVLLVIVYNRLYFEIHLLRATKILNKELKKATREQVREFTRGFQDVLDSIIDEMTNGYDEMAKAMTDKQMKE